MADQDVKTAYKEAKFDIAHLLEFFSCELTKEPKDLNWAHVGNLKHVKSELLETLSFLSGFTTGQIERTLEEAKM
ncbi:MAG: hypothetical protein PHF37_01925 [Phycisphaerae bacterium]|nr:hypothetical protein [Phycisphaerae bacterium]